MVRYLVTGGAGFIGSHLVHELLAARADAEVVVLDRLTYAADPDGLPTHEPRMTLVVGDVTDAPLVRDLCAGTDVVLHLAAESHVDRSIADGGGFVQSNTLGTAVVLDACRATGVQRIVHVSTDEVYGSITAGRWTEDAPVDPRSPYSASKAGADLLALAQHRTHGLPVLVTRCSNNYGPGQYPEKLVPLFVTRLLDGLDVPLYGDGRHVRDWLHVRDHCRALLLLAERGTPGAVYNIGGGTELTNRELTGMLLELTGAGSERIRPVPDRPGHDLRYAVDDSRARALGYRPICDLRSGLAATVAWYRDNRGWWESRRPAAIPLDRARALSYPEPVR